MITKLIPHFTKLIPHWKKILFIIALVGIILISYQQGYKSRELIALKDQIQLQERIIEAKKVEIVQTDKVVTEYSHKIITVEKLVPYFVDRVRTGITDEENANCVLPKSFTDIYKESLMVNK